MKSLISQKNIKYLNYLNKNKRSIQTVEVINLMVCHIKGSIEAIDPAI